MEAVVPGQPCRAASGGGLWALGAAHRPFLAAHGPAQVKKCADSGADLVRITVQGKREAEACMKIRERLFQDGCARACVCVFSVAEAEEERGGGDMGGARGGISLRGRSRK